MYKIEWDKETGGVILNTKVTDATLGIAPRPVFYEELDLLGLDKLGWEYPHSNNPIMWAVNKQYFYKGIHLFDAKNADIYNKPTLQFFDDIDSKILVEVDMESMLNKNSDLMFVLENEAIEFIRDTYNTYTKANAAYHKTETNKLDYDSLAENLEKKTKQKMAVVKEDCDSFDIMPLSSAKEVGKKILLSTKIDRFIASFSGGKDSQVVLDLCTRSIPPTDFEVIYSDTGYELPPSLQLYEDVQTYYKKKFPGLKFLMAKNHESVLNYWDIIGSPSDTHRWCCSIMKTVPLYRLLKSEDKKNIKFLAFEGVRAEESVKRNGYDRIGKGVKHNFVINARPILKWNTTEVFLYLFRYGLQINSAYRLGKPRVGCILCPFGSPWDDMIVNNCYKEKLTPFLSRIEKVVEERKIPNKTEYIAERKWKMRGSGKYSKNIPIISFTATSNTWTAKVSGSRKRILEWLPVVGEYSIQETDKGINGELNFKNEIFHFEVIYNGSKANYSFILHDNNNVSLRYYLRRMINKVAFCINCEACELECPTGALSVYPEVKIDKSLCIHCHKCLEYHNVGCIVADSSFKTLGTNLLNMKISKYGTFGIHEEWVDQYLKDSENFWNDNVLGVKQVPSFKAWLKDAEIIDAKCNITPFGRLCNKINEESTSLLWEIIYINLAYNSPMFNWFITSIPFNKEIVRSELDVMAIDFFQSDFKESTIKYAVQALIQSFKYSPIGEEMKQYIVDNGAFRRIGYEELSPEAVAYSLFKYAEKNNIKMFRVSDLYRPEENRGVYKEFGISKNNLLKSLRYLSTEKNRLLVAELNMGLDHITLREDLTAITALETIFE